VAIEPFRSVTRAPAQTALMVAMLLALALAIGVPGVAPGALTRTAQTVDPSAAPSPSAGASPPAAPSPASSVASEGPVPSATAVPGDSAAAGAGSSGAVPSPSGPAAGDAAPSAGPSAARPRPFAGGASLAGAVLGTDGGTAVPGLPGTGYVTVDASEELTGLTVTVPLDTLPNGFEITGLAGPAGSVCARTDATLSCTGVAVAPGRTRAVAVTVATASGLPAGVTWTVDVTAVAGAGESAQGHGDLLRTAEPQPGVRAEVAGPTGPVTVGGTTTVTVTVTTAGPSDAAGETVAVLAPYPTRFGALPGRTGTDCTALAPGQLRCTVTGPAHGAPIVWVLPLVVSSGADADEPARGGCVSLDADVSCDDPDDVDLPDFALRRPLRRTTTVTLRPADVRAGASGTARIVVAATADLRDLTVTIPLGTLPAGLTVTAARVPAGGCDVATTRVTCAGIAVPAGREVAVALTVDADAAAGPDVTWPAAGIALAEAGAPDDRLLAAGPLARVAAAAQVGAAGDEDGAAGTQGGAAPEAGGADDADAGVVVPGGAGSGPAVTVDVPGPVPTPAPVAAPVPSSANDNATTGGSPGATAPADQRLAAGSVTSVADRGLAAPLVLAVMLVVGGLAARIVTRNRPRRRSGGTPAGTL
jgi:large repetitive protein